MHIELLLGLVVPTDYLTYDDQFALAWTCVTAYKLIEPKVRAQVERIVKHLESGRTAHPSECLQQYVNLWSTMEIADPRIQKFYSLGHVTVLERSLLYGILGAWFNTYGGTIVDSKKTWICTANDALLPTSLPNEDARCRFSYSEEYTVIIKTRMFTHDVVSIDCVRDHAFTRYETNEDAWFDKRVMSKVLKSTGKHCDVNQIMTVLGFYYIKRPC